MRMLKVFAAVLLISACSSTYAEKGSEQLTLSEQNIINWNELLKCIMDTKPIAYDIKDLIEAIQEKNPSKAISIVYKIISDGNLVFLQCIKIVPEWEKFFNEGLPFKWNDLIKCIIDSEPVAQKILLLIKALKDKDYPVALSIVYQLLVKGEKVIKQCIAVFTPKFLSTPPVAPSLIETIQQMLTIYHTESIKEPISPLITN